MASKTCTPHREAFKEDTLKPVVGKAVQVANGAILYATHIGTVCMASHDVAGRRCLFEMPDCWLVPGLSMSLVSFRGLKALSGRHPDFNEMTVLDGMGRAFPIYDEHPSFLLKGTIPTQEDIEGAEIAGGMVSLGGAPDSRVVAAVVAHGRRAIPTSKLSAAEAATLYHSALGHVGADSLRRIIDADTGLTDAQKDKIRAGISKIDCEICRQANIERQPAPTANIAAGEDIGFVVADLKGPLPRCEVGPFAGARYIAMYADIAGKYAGVYMLKRKSQALSAYRKFKADAAAVRPGYRVRIFRSDSGGEFTSDEFVAECERDMTQKTLGAPYTPNQTLIESSWRFLGRVVRAGLLESGLALGYWPYFALLAGDLRNLLPREGGKSGHELFTGRPARKVHAMKPIGCRAWVRKQAHELRAAGSAAISERGWAGINLGVARDSPAYMIYVPDLGKIKYSTDVEFAPHLFPMAAAPPELDEETQQYLIANPAWVIATGGTGGGGDGANLFLGNDAVVPDLHTSSGDPLDDSSGYGGGGEGGGELEQYDDPVPPPSSRGDDSEATSTRTRRGVGGGGSDDGASWDLPMSSNTANDRSDDEDARPTSRNSEDDVPVPPPRGEDADPAPPSSWLPRSSPRERKQARDPNDLREWSAVHEFDVRDGKAKNTAPVHPDRYSTGRADALLEAIEAAVGDPIFDSGRSPPERPTGWEKPLCENAGESDEAIAAAVEELLDGVGAVDAHDISSLCGAEETTAVVLQLDHRYVLAVRRESALATRVLTTSEALGGPQAELYQGAIGTEMGAHLEQFGTFTLIPLGDKPKGESLIGLKMLLAEKTGALGEFVKAKARLVARGDQMRPNVDFDPFKTTAPMLRYSSLRMMCAIAAITSRPLSTSDATSAYLNSVLDKPFYGRFPPFMRSQYVTPDGEELIALVTRCLYGHAESGHRWHKDIVAHLTSPRAEGGMGFTRSAADPCMFVWREGDKWALLGLATDNLVHLSSHDAVQRDVIARLQAKFTWVDEGVVNDVPSVLGTKIRQDLSAGTVSMSQEGYIEALGEEYKDHLTSARRCETPASEELEQRVLEALASKAEARDPKLVTFYQKLVGSLIFASITTRPDIAWAVGMLSRGMAWPTEALAKEAVRCLRYLVQHKSLGLNYSRSTFFSARAAAPQQRRKGMMGGLSGVITIDIDEGSSDSDFAAGPSVSGWEWRMAGAAVCYGSKRQSSTMLSSAAAELVAGSTAATDGIYLRNLLEELGWAQQAPSQLWMDNQAAVLLAHDPQAFQKTKHVARRHHFLRECVENKEIKVGKIHTDHNVSDIFTKALKAKKFKLFRACVMNLPMESLG